MWLLSTVVSTCLTLLLKSNRTICIDLAFESNLFWCDLWVGLHMKMHDRTVGIFVASPHCEWASAVSGFRLDQMNIHIVHICVNSPQCGWSCASSLLLLNQLTSYILSKCGPSLHCGWARGAFFRLTCSHLSWPKILCSRVRILKFLEPPREMP